MKKFWEKYDLQIMSVVFGLCILAMLVILMNSKVFRALDAQLNNWADETIAEREDGR